MIAKITGILESVNLTEVIVDVGGIGYEIIIPLSTYDKLPRAGGKVSLLTYLHVREDAMTLYGFATPDEKELYKILISVSGYRSETGIENSQQHFNKFFLRSCFSR